MKNPLEKMFVGSMIAYEDRQLGFSYAQRTDLGVTEMQDETSKVLLNAIKLAEGKWSTMPTPDNLATIIISEGLVPMESTEPEALAGIKDKIIGTAIEFAKIGAKDVAAFHQMESMLYLKHQDELLVKFATQDAPTVAKNPIGSPVDKGEELLTQLQAITNAWTPESNIFTLDDQIREVYEARARQRKMIENRERIMTLPPELGRLCGIVPRLRRGLLYVIKGPTKGGKSSIMGQISEWLARGYKGVYFCWEDSVDRKLYQQTCRLVDGATFDHLDRGDYENHLEKVIKIRQEWAKTGGSLIFVHCPGKSAAWAVQTINKLQNQYGLDFVFCDYLQKMDISHLLKAGYAEYSAYAASAEVLKQRAEQKGKEVVMFVGSQETKDANGKSHTRGGIDLEMKAQCVMSIRRKDAEEDEIFNGMTLANKGDKSVWTEIWVEYNNDGGTGYESLINWKPRFMFISQQAITNGINGDNSFIPVMRKPSDQEVLTARQISDAYKNIGQRTMPY